MRVVDASALGSDALLSGLRFKGATLLVGSTFPHAHMLLSCLCMHMDACVHSRSGQVRDTGAGCQSTPCLACSNSSTPLVTDQHVPYHDDDAMP